MRSRLVIYPELASTQDTVRDAALKGEPEGLAVMALNQTCGHGRRGRVWVSPPGKNLALSLLMRPAMQPGDAALMGLLVSVAVAETAEELGVDRALLKWPNDVQVDGGKLAGILPEAQIMGGSVEFIVMGIGLNVNGEPADFPAHLRDSMMSIFQCSGRRWDVEEVARLMLNRIEGHYRRVETEGAGFIPALWETRWAHLGHVLHRDGQTGIAEGLDPDGALLLRTHAGDLIRIHSGVVEPVDSAGFSGSANRKPG